MLESWKKIVEANYQLLSPSFSSHFYETPPSRILFFFLDSSVGLFMEAAICDQELFNDTFVPAMLRVP